MNLSHASSRSRQKQALHLPDNNLPAPAVDSVQKSLSRLGRFSERMRLEQALLTSQRRIQELEKNRDRMKGDLHDGVLQSLYAVGLGLASCGLLLHKDPSQVTEQLKRSAVQLDQALRELRSLLQDDIGDDIGGKDLDGALHGLVEAMAGLSSIECRVTIDPMATASIRKEHQKHILNFAREALSNSIRHAQATKVEITLTLKNGTPCLQISDDGIGFLADHPPRLGLGLRSLTARASDVGGRVEIDSRPPQGTRIVLRLPGQ